MNTENNENTARTNDELNDEKVDLLCREMGEKTFYQLNMHDFFGVLACYEPEDFDKAVSKLRERGDDFATYISHKFDIDYTAEIEAYIDYRLLQD